MGNSRSAPVNDTRKPDDVWSTCSTLLHGDLTKAPFWLTPQAAQALPRVYRAGIFHGPKLWAARKQAEAAAVALHGAVPLAERRRAALEQPGLAPRAEQRAVGRPQQPRGGCQNGTVVLLHGAGDSGAAIAAWCDECGLPAALRRRGLALAAPDAPWRRFSPACGETWRVWYDRLRGGDVEADVEDACRAVAAEVRRTGVSGGRDSRRPHVVFVVGFSQGGPCALHCALRGYLDDLGPSHQFGGVAAMAGWLDRASASYEALWQRVERARGGGSSTTSSSSPCAVQSQSPHSPAPAPPQLDLLLLHGLADEVVPAAWVQRNEQRLRELSPPGGSVTVRRKGLPGLAHEVTPEEVSVLVAWIDQRLRALGVEVDDANANANAN